MQIKLEVQTKKLQKTKFITRTVIASKANTIELYGLSKRTLNHQQWVVKPGNQAIHNDEVYTIKEVTFSDAKPSNLQLTLDKKFPAERYNAYANLIHPLSIFGDLQGNKLLLFITPSEERRFDFNHFYLQREDGKYFKVKSYTTESTNPRYITAEVEEMFNPSTKDLIKEINPDFNENSKLYVSSPTGWKEVY